MDGDPDPKQGDAAEPPGHDEPSVLLPIGRKSTPDGETEHYSFLGEIGRGGMGIVLRSRDNDLGRDVAFKILHEDYASDSLMLQRFVEEAQIGGQLQHPGVVPVYEIGVTEDEKPYFTMKLVKGRTLAAVLRARTDVESGRHELLTVFESIAQTMA